MNSADLRILAELRRNDTFSAAADALGLAHTTVSRKVRELEAHFGAGLIERVGDKIVLTTEGEAAASASDKIEDELTALERVINGRDGRLFGHISLTTVDILAWHYMEQIGSFCSRFPEIELTVSSESEVKSLSRREAEVALRLTNTPEQYLFGQVVGRFDFAPYAARSTIVKDMEKAVWLDYASQECSMRSSSWMKANVPKARAKYFYSTPLMMLRAVEAGTGIGLLPVQVAQTNENLCRLGEDVAFGLDIWLLAPKELRHTARIRALFDTITRRHRANLGS